MNNTSVAELFKMVIDTGNYDPGTTFMCNELVDFIHMNPQYETLGKQATHEIGELMVAISNNSSMKPSVFSMYGAISH